jgi:hypothetical protein
MSAASRLRMPLFLERRLRPALALSAPTTYRCTSCYTKETRSLADCVLMVHLHRTRCSCGAYWSMPRRVLKTLNALTSAS